MGLLPVADGSLGGWRPWRMAAMGRRPYRTEAVVDAGRVERRLLPSAPLVGVALAGGGHYVAVPGESGG